MKRVPPSERLREEVFWVLQQGAEEGSPLRTFIRQAARYVLQVAVEQEVREFLGRYKEGL